MGMVLIQTFTVLLTGIYIMVKLCFTEKEQTVSDLAAHLHILQMQYDTGHMQYLPEVMDGQRSMAESMIRTGQK